MTPTQALRLAVTGPQRLAILLIARFTGIPAGQVARRPHVHPSTSTGILPRLERQGLVRRRSNPQAMTAEHAKPGGSARPLRGVRGGA